MGGIYIKGLPMPRGEDEGFLIAIFDGFAQKVGTREEFVAYEVVSEMEKTTRWIPVTERLPEPHKDVLVSGMEAINNSRVYKVMVNDDGIWRPRNYAPSIIWDYWMPIDPLKEE